MVTSSAVVGSSATGDHHGDHDALVHAARELMGKVRKPALRRRDAHLPQQLDGALLALVPGEAQVAAQHLLDLEADGKTWVEGGHGLLEDHRDVLADDLPPLGGRHPKKLPAIEGHAVGGNGGGPG
jgi:hypothetical protein